MQNDWRSEINVGKFRRQSSSRYGTEVNRMCKPDFLLNVALNKSKEITAAFAGKS